MKFLLFVSMILMFSLVAKPANAEGIHFQPGLNLFQEVATLTDLMGPQGSELCGPIAVTHAFNFLKYTRTPPFPKLLPFPDMDHDGVANTYRDQIRFFFQTCKTDRAEGTHYRDLVSCMRDYQSQSGLGTWAFMIGPDASETPPGAVLSDVQHPIDLSDIRYFVGAQAAVIMGVGWYRFDPSTQTYTRAGGHLFNVYGYDYRPENGATEISLDVVNSWVDYQNRPREQMFDQVTMKALPSDGSQYPAGAKYRVIGTGFQFNEQAFVEDLMVSYPVNPASSEALPFSKMLR